MKLWNRRILVAMGLMIAGVAAIAAVETQYRIQLTTVSSEEDAKQLVQSLQGQTRQLLEILPYQGKYYILAGTFSDAETAVEAAKEPALKEFAGLDVVRIAVEQSALNPGDTVFQVQLGNFSTLANAETTQAEAMDRGLSPVRIVESGGYFKVRYGQFSSREAATADLGVVHQAGYGDAWITSAKVEQSSQSKQVLRIEPMKLFAQAPPSQIEHGPAKTVSMEAPIQLTGQPEPATEPILPPAQAIWQAPPAPPVPPMPSQAFPAQAPEVTVLTQAVREARKKSEIPILVKADGADEVVLHYRLKGGKSFIKVPMVQDAEGNWKADIPGWAVTTLGVEYFVQAKKGFRRFTGEATEENPYLIQVK